MGIPGAGPFVRVATKLPIPKATGTKVLNAQLGCAGAHWQTVTLRCHLWVLTGTCASAWCLLGSDPALAVIHLA